MKFYIELFSKKRWVFYGSVYGGIVGALVMYLNFSITKHSSIFSPLPPNSHTIIMIGMTGGMLGGAIGSFLAGTYVRDNVAFNLGVPLGIGVLNGFVIGTATGFILSLINSKYPSILNTTTVSISILLLLVIAAVLAKLKKRNQIT